MIVCRYFVFVHTPKTGGIWIRKTLAPHVPKAWHPYADRRAHNEQHRPYRQLPPEVTDRPAIAVVRNPWDWWLSWFMFMKQRPPKGPGSERWTSRFKRYPATIAGFRRALPLLLRRPSPQWDMIVDAAGDVGPRLVRFETLRAGIVDAMKETGAPVPKPMRDALQKAPKLNISKHKHYREYYDDASRDAVAEHEQQLIECCGYEF